MGIIKFRNWLDFFHSKDVKSKDAHEIYKIACLFLDMNSLIHNVTQRFYAYGDNLTDEDKLKQKKYLKTKSLKELEDECIREILIEIFNIVMLIKPKEYLVLAVDGVAPMAKIAQQRKRRYKSKSIKPEQFDLDEDPDIEPVSPYFNPDCVTPGTEFMMKLDESIREFLYLNTKRRDAVFPKNVIYSSHLVAGEGEHKIFELLRSGEIEIQDKDAVNIINGEDADLVMLSMLCPEEVCPNLFLWRNAVDRKTKKPNNDFFNIDAIRHFVHEELLVNENVKLSVPKIYTTRDFVFLLYLIGNDFVPSITTLTSNKTGDVTINFILDKYSGNFILDLTEDSDPEDFMLIRSDNSINWKRFYKFMGILSKYEETLIRQMAANQNRYAIPFEAITKSIISSKVNAVTNKLEVDVDFHKYRELYYSKALSPISQKGKDFLMKEHIEGYPYTKNGIQVMVYQYLKALQWIFQYYMTGTHGVSSRYVYNYHYAPLLSEIYHLIDYFYEEGTIPSLELIKRKPSDPYITPIHQLMMVMHPKSWNLIPQPYQGLMTKRFMDISPFKFKIDKEGFEKNRKGEVIHSIPLIPFVDPERMILETRDYPIPMIYREASNIFILTIQNVRAPNVAISLRDAQKMEERKAKRFAPKGPIEESLDDDEITFTSKVKTKSVGKKYVVEEEPDEEDEEITFTAHMSHSMKTPNRIAKASKKKIEIEEEKEEEAILMKEAFKRAKRPQWVARPLM